MSASIFAKGMVWLFKKGHFEKFLDRFERSHQEVLSINEDQLKAQVKKGNYQTNILTHSFGERQMRKRDAGLFIPFIWLVALFWAILMLPVGIPLA